MINAMVRLIQRVYVDNTFGMDPERHKNEFRRVRTNDAVHAHCAALLIERRGRWGHIDETSVA